MSEYERHIFNGLCPYTGKPCETFECDKCEIEAEERKWLEELEVEE